MREVRLLSPTGLLGSGYSETSFERGLGLDPHAIVCDGGSSDGGPISLGSGHPVFSRQSTKRDLRLMLLGRQRLGVPLIVGSCGSAGGDIGVDWVRDICLEIAEAEGLRFHLVLIRSEQDKAYLKRRFREGRIRPLKPAPELDEEAIGRSAHIVGMMGHEPIENALTEGADVVLAGRASDTSLFASVSMRMGMDPGVSWHAAKILECGAACVATRKRPDGVFGWIREDHFVVEPLDPEMQCTPQSVAAHSLYENADPFLIAEPGGTLDMSEAAYAAENDRAVRVTGSRFREAATYTVKLEGTETVGYQTVIIGGVRDPYVIRQLDPWLERMREGFRRRVEEIFGGRVGEADYSITIRVYGRDAVMGPLTPASDKVPDEVGLLFEVTAADQETATAIAQTLAHHAVHYPIPEWNGLVSNIAYPFAPSEIERGVVYRFNMNHVVEPDDPYEMFRVEKMAV